ncbi:15669_t:CDS:1, partial [Gigaspora rosea]
MEFELFPKPFKKTIALLQKQLKFAHIKGSIIITQDTIEYGIGEEKEMLHLSECTYISDTQRMQDKLPYFLEDLRRLEFTPQALLAIDGETWQLQVQRLCQSIGSSKVSATTRLGYYYQLGTLLATLHWNDEAR